MGTGSVRAGTRAAGRGGGRAEVPSTIDKDSHRGSSFARDRTSHHGSRGKSAGTAMNLHEPARNDQGGRKIVGKPTEERAGRPRRRPARGRARRRRQIEPL